MAGKDLGEIVTGWIVPPRPGPVVLEGRFVRLERLDPTLHADDLFRAFAVDPAIRDYMSNGPFAETAACRARAGGMAPLTDPLFYVLHDRATGHYGGVASYLRIAPEAGSIGVGNIVLAPKMQRTRRRPKRWC